MKLYPCLVLLGGCAISPTTSVLPEGTEGADRIGHTSVPWVVVDGEKRVSEDYSLGPAVDEPVAYAASVNLDSWPNNIVPYCIHRGSDPLAVGASAVTTIRDALAALTVHPAGGGRGVTPLQFVEYACADALAASFAFVDYRHNFIHDFGETTAALDHVGTTIALAGIDERVVWHETGHALGFMHEQQRPDRPQHLNFNPQCLADSSEASQFDVKPAAKLLSPYDIDSIMQYASYNFSSDPTQSDANTCPTVLDGGNDPAHAPPYPAAPQFKGSYIDLSPFWSYEDINAAYQIHEPVLANCTSNDRLGSAMVSGDFDGDGYADLAVATAVNTVALYKGTMNGLVAWRVLRASDFDGTAGASDGFGAALAVGHLPTGLDVTPGDDLLIGAPRYANNGAIYVYRHSGTGPFAAAGPILQPGVSFFGGANFGSALAFGTFDRAKGVQLAVGSPGLTAGGMRGGWVNTGSWDGSTFQFSATIVQPSTSQIGDLFGASLAVGDFTNDGVQDLAVGAPGIGNGSVVIFRGGGALVEDQLLAEGAPVGPHDRFGQVLAAGQLVAGGADELAVGAPAAGGGRVVEFSKVPGGKLNRLATLTELTTLGADRFGAALAITNLDGDGVEDLLVGVPAKGDGVIDIFMPGQANRIAIGAPAVASGGFGSAIATGNFNGPGANRVIAPNRRALDLAIDVAVGANTATCGASTLSGGLAYFRQATDGSLVLARQFTERDATPASAVP